MKKVYLIITILMALILSACASTSSPTPIPTLVLDGGNNTNNNTNKAPQTSSGDSVTASAVVVPASQADLAFIAGGNVKTVNVAVGDVVKTGQVLVELDNAIIQLDVEQAKRTLRELTSPAAIAAAEGAVANAQKVYDDAKKKVDSNKLRHTDNLTVNYLKDQVTLAQNALDRARDDYKKTGGHSNVDPVRAKAGTNLYNAQKAYNTAVGNLNWYTQPPSELDVAIANADFDAATAALQETKWYLSELKGETIPADATGAQLTQLQQARDNLQAIQDRLNQTRLIAPFNGTVAAVNMVAGEFVAPGQVLVVVSDTNRLQVKTTDLSERDIVNVKIDAPAVITVEASGEEFEGTVSAISPLANTLGGDVVYEVTIEFTEQPEGVLGGMSAEVNIAVE